MNQDDVVARVKLNPKYADLVATRNAYGWVMTALMMIAYFGYILLIAFNKAWLGTKIGEGWTTSIGIPLGLGVILFTIVITWIYVHRANTEFDDLNAEVIREAMKK